jgi:ubiquinone biosynthesis protein
MHDLSRDVVSYLEEKRVERIQAAARQGDVATRVPLWRVLLRVAAVAAVLVLVLAPAAASTLAVRLRRGRDAGRRHLFRRVVRLLQVLGPTYVKYGQIAGTRRDALPAALCDELGVLHDAVKPMSARQAEGAFRAGYGDELEAVFASVGKTPVATGSIACVYPAVLADGRAVALKLKRPGIDNRMRADLDLVRRMVKVAERMPKLRGMPMAELTGYVSQAILGQLDFAREAASIVRLRGILAGLPEVRVPELYAEYSRPECLAFEHIPDLDGLTPVTLPSEVRRRLGGTVLMAAGTMMFEHGFVHCDMHPGNVYLTPDEHVVILDAGYSVQIPDRVRRLIGEFFACLQAGNGQRCAEIVLESAVHVAEHTDVDTFTADVTDLVAASARRPFDMFTFGNAMFELQRQHGIYAASDFAFPLMSLLVLEGTITAIAPGVDFRQVGAAGPQPPHPTPSPASPATGTTPAETTPTAHTVTTPGHR